MAIVAATFLCSAGAFVFSMFYVSQGAVELNPGGLTTSSLTSSFVFIALFAGAAVLLLKDPYRLLVLSLPLAVAVSDLAGDLSDFFTGSLYTHVAFADLVAASVPLAVAVWTLTSWERGAWAAPRGR